MMSRLARGAALLILAAGIVVAILLPVRFVVMGQTDCPSFPAVACRLAVTAVKRRLLLRFAIAIASALPLAILLSGRSVRRWMVVVATVVVSSGIALAVVLPSSGCLGLAGVFCASVDHGWERFAIVVAAFGVGVVLVAASRLAGSRSAVRPMLLMAGIGVALFLPSTEGSPLFVASGTYTGADHRVPWRMAMALAGAVPFGLGLVLATVRRAEESYDRWGRRLVAILILTGAGLVAIFLPHGSVRPPCPAKPAVSCGPGLERMPERIALRWGIGLGGAALAGLIALVPSRRQPDSEGGLPPPGDLTPPPTGG